MNSLRMAISMLLNNTHLIMKNNTENEIPPVYAKEDNPFVIQHKKYLLDCCKNSNMFYVPKLDVNEKENFSDKTCPPFQNCWFEFTPPFDDNKSEVVKDLKNKIEINDMVAIEATITGFGLFEITPETYICIVILKDHARLKDEPDYKLGETDCMAVFPFSFENIGKLPPHYYDLIKATLSRLDRSKFHYVQNSQEIRERGRIDKQLIKIKYKPSDVIYLSDLRTLKKDYPEVAKRIINKPAYAYEVSGHWRKCEGTIGKDRNGLRGVNGYTWVIPHVRGEGEIFKKSRILAGGKHGTT